MLIVTILWGPLIARVTLDTQETEQHALVNMITLFSILLDVVLFLSHIQCTKQRINCFPFNRNNQIMAKKGERFHRTVLVTML